MLLSKWDFLLLEIPEDSLNKTSKVERSSRCHVLSNEAFEVGLWLLPFVHFDIHIKKKKLNQQKKNSEKVFWWGGASLSSSF